MNPADIITISRIVSSLCLVFFHPASSAFGVLYLWCGVSDVLDGFIARTLRTESDRGAMLDTAADLAFAAVYAVMILPILPVPLWIGVWTALIAAAKVLGIVLASVTAHRWTIAHSVGNKLI